MSAATTATAAAVADAASCARRGRYDEALRVLEALEIGREHV